MNPIGTIQWVLYYPAILDPDELSLTTAEHQTYATSLANYREGNLVAALDTLPPAAPVLSPGARCLRAMLLLAVGRVAEAEALLNGLPDNFFIAEALRELIATVRGQTFVERGPSNSTSVLLARSYALQARGDLPAALHAARDAAQLSRAFGIAHARVAELEFSFGNRKAALRELDLALQQSPKLATIFALRGFILLDQGDISAALSNFDHARSIDAAFGPSWLGRGLCLMRNRDFTGARLAFQAAAALEPQRSLFRSYLAKAASQSGDSKAAEKEFRLAKRLDLNDPTACLYSALHLWQENRLNEAIRDLEHSADLNDQRAPFRSRLLLESDRSVRSANLAALYADAGLNEASKRMATRSVAEAYANFSGHLFLANSFQSLEDVNRFDLRLETARQSELLVANLLAPPGAGNLSQLLSQQEHLRFFEPQPIGFSSLTEYASRGDWRQSATVFGNVDGFNYALDSFYESINGQAVNDSSERRQYILTSKQRVTADDELYIQAGDLHAKAGDIALRYDPNRGVPGFHVQETQEPTLYAGWHHTWSPGSHTLFLASRLNDRLDLINPLANTIFLDESGGVIGQIQSPPLGPPFTNTFGSRFNLYSAELQHIWETPRESLVLGGRWQYGNIENSATVSRDLTGNITNQRQAGVLQRANVYAYNSWRILDPIRLIAGVSYDRIRFPENTDLPPLSNRASSHDLVSPKLGLLITPWERALFRATWTKSLGGLFFDNS
ncbi:MAG TPA: TonB-dependent receptor, partial [Verrucomicrobiae bacterium]